MERVKLNIRVVNAESFCQRFVGFMFKKDAEYALLFKNCKSIHTFFMRFDLDIIYLDKCNKVVKVIKQLKPFKIALPIKNAVSILEIPSNITENIDSVIVKKLIDF
ncbi:MAG: DUF192 domain-containing protein [Endomicrobium sp.]|jgi:uncharacterized membrane protein (UPF0127 family)|nr:DUF192 domain-containing protein [Endomicrobium sp.]